MLSKYVNADIIVLPSTYEGFPLALSEGMSAGLPGVGFRECMGVNEIIEDVFSCFVKSIIDNYF